jgi:hypothetical protein
MIAIASWKFKPPAVITLTLNDRTRSIAMQSTGSIEIKAKTTVDIQGMSINIKASGVVTVNGALIKLN